MHQSFGWSWDGLEYWQKEDGFDMGDIIERFKEEYDRVTNQKEGV